MLKIHDLYSSNSNEEENTEKYILHITVYLLTDKIYGKFITKSCSFLKEYIELM